MALLECIECGGKVSDRAEHCIHCGCPISYIINSNDEMKNTYNTEVNSHLEFEAFDAVDNELNWKSRINNANEYEEIKCFEVVENHKKCDFKQNRQDNRFDEYHEGHDDVDYDSYHGYDYDDDQDYETYEEIDERLDDNFYTGDGDG